MKLNFFARRAGEPALCFETADLNVLGCDISGFLGSRVRAHLTTAGWDYCGTCYPVIAVTGGGSLLFETEHNLTLVSDPVDHLYFIGGSLSANGAAVAKYHTDEDLWHGIQRPMLYRSFRIVQPESMLRAAGGRASVRLNPWENYLPSTSDPGWAHHGPLLHDLRPTQILGSQPMAAPLHATDRQRHPPDHNARAGAALLTANGMLSQ